MREIFTDKKYIISKIAVALKIALIFALFIFFLPLLVLPFFNHASADDYYYGVQFYKAGFWGYQQYIYHNWSGRFSSILLGSLFLQDHFLYNHYNVHSLLFLTLNFVLNLLLIKSLHKYILIKKTGYAEIFLEAFIFTALTILCIPDVFSFIFWFSSVLIYYAGLIFVQAVILLFIELNSTGRQLTKLFCYILLPVLVVIVNGFSEVFIVIQFFIFCLLFSFGFFKSLSKIFTTILVLCFIASALLSFLSPGNSVRAQTIPALGTESYIAAIVYCLLRVLWIIFKNPLSWFVLIFLFFAGYEKRKTLPGYFLNRIYYYVGFLSAVAILFIIFSISEGVIGLKGRIVPDRFINIVCWFAILLLSVLSFIVGAGIKRNLFSYHFHKAELNVLCYTLLILSVCCNDYIGVAYKSILSAPVFNTIMSDRENTIKRASDKNTIPVIKSYDLAFAEYMQQYHPKAGAIYSGWAQQKPALIFNNNGDTDDQSIKILQRFYNIDSLVIRK